MTVPNVDGWPDAGIARMASWLRGTARRPRGCKGPHWTALGLACLALCVDGYDRRGGPERLEEWATAFQARLKGAQLEREPTAALLDLLYFQRVPGLVISSVFTGRKAAERLAARTLRKRTPATPARIGQ